MLERMDIILWDPWKDILGLRPDYELLHENLSYPRSEPERKHK